jgi:hypothetical protein
VAPSAPVVLIDGPCAGQVVHTDPGATMWNVPNPPSHDFMRVFDSPELIARMDWYTSYRIHRAVLVVGTAPDTFEQIPVRVGWSLGAEPDQVAMWRIAPPALKQLGILPMDARIMPPPRDPDRPIGILQPGTPPRWNCLWCCDATVRMSRDQSHMQGVCRCGWLTEPVPRRRAGELMDLADTHRAVTRTRAETEQAVHAERARASLPNDADWLERGSTCSHVCGGDADHRCDAKATTCLAFKLPSGGTRNLPLCAPCAQSEAAASVGS